MAPELRCEIAKKKDSRADAAEPIKWCFIQTDCSKFFHETITLYYYLKFDKPQLLFVRVRRS